MRLSNFGMSFCYFDVEVFEKFGEGYWAQGQFLVHGYDDVLWTSDPEQVALFIRESLEKAIKDINKEIDK